MAESNVRFSLLENGLDFILSSVKLTVNPQSASDYKYSILHLSAGVELILKERLKLEHWRFVFEKTKYASEELLKSGDFKSVGLETSIKRLTEEIGVEISANHLDVIRDLKRRRNKIEHFEFQETEIGLKSVLVKVLNFVFDFVNAELSELIKSKKVEEQIAEIRLNLVQFEDFIKVRNEELKPKLGDLDPDTDVVQCPFCYQKYLVLDFTQESELKCLFCLTQDTPDNVALDYSSNILGFSHYLAVTEGGEFPTHTCPSCGCDSFVRHDETYICFNCCEVTSSEFVDDCGQCGQKFFVHEDDFGICKACWDYKVNGPD